MEPITAEGKCVFCDGLYADTDIARHLGSHLKKMADASAKRKMLHLSVKSEPHFLHLLVAETTTFEDLDDFLRDIWLECCGHLSGFRIGDRQVTLDAIRDDFFGNDDDIDFDESIDQYVKKGTKMTYDYDYGSTTRLEIKVMNIYAIPRSEVAEDFVLLSRNEPLKLRCEVCERKPGEVVCILLHEEASLFCAACAKQHEKECEDFADYAALPLVNSPRTGVCAYEGGSIDQERDGIWTGE